MSLNIIYIYNNILYQFHRDKPIIFLFYCVRISNDSLLRVIYRILAAKTVMKSC